MSLCENADFCVTISLFGGHCFPYNFFFVWKQNFIFTRPVVPADPHVRHQRSTTRAPTTYWRLMFQQHQQHVSSMKVTAARGRMAQMIQLKT